MNRRSILGKMLLGTAVLALSFGTTSCKDNKDKDATEMAEDQNEEKFDDSNEAKEEDSDYLVFAADVNMKEIELGKLAQQKKYKRRSKGLCRNAYYRSY